MPAATKIKRNLDESPETPGDFATLQIVGAYQSQDASGASLNVSPVTLVANMGQVTTLTVPDGAITLEITARTGGVRYGTNTTLTASGGTGTGYSTVQVGETAVVSVADNDSDWSFKPDATATASVVEFRFGGSF